MKGIVCAGHWVLDYIKFIDDWPNRSEICTILSEHVSNGGAPFNIIVDLANLQTQIPTVGVGCIGDDEIGKKILEISKEKNLTTEFLHILKDQKTSYTDVMTIKSIGERTMFHYHGANDLFSLEHIPIESLKNNKLFYLGHLLVMKALEEKDSEFGFKARRLLYEVKQAGMETVLDIATEKDLTRYEKIVIPCLEYVDHLIIDELEAQKLSKTMIYDDKKNIVMDNLKKAAHFLLDSGVNKNVIIHMPKGSFWATKNDEDLWQESFHVPQKLIVSSCGAGDAFCAGAMVGIHENWNRKDTLTLANKMAALSITSWHNSDGILPLNETLKKSF